MEPFERGIALLDQAIRTEKLTSGREANLPEFNNEPFKIFQRQLAQIMELIQNNQLILGSYRVQQLAHTARAWTDVLQGDPTIIPDLVYRTCNNIYTLAIQTWYSVPVPWLDITSVCANIAAIQAQICAVEATDLCYFIEEEVDYACKRAELAPFDRIQAAKEASSWYSGMAKDLQEIAERANKWAELAQRISADINDLVAANTAVATISAYIIYAEKKAALH